MKNRFRVFLGAALLAGPLAANALPVTLDFTHLTDALGNNEPGIPAVLLGASSAGLTLSQSGLAFNVGCGSTVSCFGADATTVDDFRGTISGVFSGPSSLLSISYVQPFSSSATLLFDSGNNQIASFFGSFTYNGANGSVSRFRTSLSFDAYSTISFDLQPRSVPEPGTLALLGFGLAGMGLLRRRKLA